MSIIGASGSNAFTSSDMTVYQEDIPSNQIENWAKIEADRFIHPVIRGFHTELETVYEGLRDAGCNQDVLLHYFRKTEIKNPFKKLAHKFAYDE